MRKEGVIIVISGLLLLALSANYYHLFNAISSFMLAGVIPGTSFSLPDSFMLVVTILALLAATAWPFRHTKSAVKFISTLKSSKASFFRSRQRRSNQPSA